MMDIRTYPDFLSADECAAFRTLLTTKTDATNFTDSGIFDNKKWTDIDLSTRFHARLLELDTVTPEQFLRANTLIMAGHYEVGDSFGLHTDTGLYYDERRREKSRWTLLIYLNDDFEGGETVFYDTNTCSGARSIQPRAGMALLFDIDLWHSGQPLRSGRKYWIGTEIIGSMKT